MYAGSLVETGPTAEDLAVEMPIRNTPTAVSEIGERLWQDYRSSMGLLRSVPRLDKPRSTEMEVIEGMPPNLADLPVGCPFAEARCAFVMDQCRAEKPVLEEVSEGHFKACFFDANQLS